MLMKPAVAAAAPPPAAPLLRRFLRTAAAIATHSAAFGDTYVRCRSTGTALHIIVMQHQRNL